jgi:hypothetical protein
VKKNKATEFTIPAAALLQAVKARVFDVGGSISGTYNPQDPTAFEDGSCYGYLEMDPYLLKNYRYTPTEEDLKEVPKEMFDYAPPPDALYKIEIKDVTWGCEVKVTFVDSSIDTVEIERYRGNFENWNASEDGADLVKPSRQVLNFYLDHDDGKILWEPDLDKVRDFMLFVLCGDMELSSKRRKFEKDMSEGELAAAEAAREADDMLRRCI